MDPLQIPTDDEYRKKVLAARDMDPSEKLLAGPRMFDEWCESVANEVRSANADATNDDIRAEIRRRLEFARKLEESDCRGRPFYTTEPPTATPQS